MSGLRELITDLRASFTLVPWRMRPKLIAIIIGSVIVALLDMVAVVLTLPMMQIISGTSVDASRSLQLIATVMGTHDTRQLIIGVLIGVVALMILKNIFTIVFRWWSLGVMADATADASYEMLSLYLSSPWARHRQRKRDDVYQTMTGYIPAAFTVTADVVLFVVDIVAALAVLLALLVVSPLSTLLALIFFGGSALVLQQLLKRGQLHYGEAAREANVRSWASLGPAVDGFKEARLVGASDSFAREYEQTRRTAAFAQRAIGVLNELPRYVLEIIMILGILLIAGVLFRSTDTASTFAFLGVFAVAAMRTVPALNRAVATLGRIRSNIPNLSALQKEIGNLRTEKNREPLSEPIHSFPAADIIFDNLSFQFPDATQPVLKSISGRIPKGSTVALVGTSGAGKTTFLDLLLSLYAPTAGGITVAGTRIDDYPLAWRRQLGVVNQDVYILGRSVRENITLGTAQDEVDEERLAEAITMSQLDEVIAAMPDGLDTVLGENGARVSGGQRQRIGIARALYRRPQVLVLDEATSALDNETEAKVTATINSLRGAMTIVVVAHRLSTVKHADQILFFQEGRIADRGTMNELSARNSDFASLVRLGMLS